MRCRRLEHAQSRFATQPLSRCSGFMVRRALALAAVLRTSRFVSALEMYSISASYLGDQCAGTPYVVSIVQADDCSIETCSASSNMSSADMRTVDCTSDFVQATRDKFGSSPYIIEMVYGDGNCSGPAMGYGYPAPGTCVGGFNETDNYYVIATLNTNGSASLELYPDRSCGTAATMRWTRPKAARHTKSQVLP
ncbi:hypothetical protein PHYPSEUDO_003952 [Phytophthora pseudosyringae]|uniref:TKL protein kinase n=1 Tax=Phytophthora pseudosyringae TaxID=221518 RepID=A0A8T1VP80_9STRA|nr:hypothetical protein PHYPSEUDO_003952 [Phytophthora pseudosyringae]